MKTPEEMAEEWIDTYAHATVGEWTQLLKPYPAHHLRKAYFGGYKSAQASQWIKCSERLPEDERYVLVSFDNLDCDVVSYSKGKWEEQEGYELDADRIYYWCELPPPPAEEGEK